MLVNPIAPQTDPTIRPDGLLMVWASRSTLKLAVLAMRAEAQNIGETPTPTPTKTKTKTTIPVTGENANGINETVLAGQKGFWPAEVCRAGPFVLISSLDHIFHQLPDSLR